MHINKKTEYSLVLDDVELITLARVLSYAKDKLEFKDLTPDYKLAEEIVENIETCARELI